jgi:uncharacterized membrane protein YoaK (UPF0700 family)
MAVTSSLEDAWRTIVPAKGDPHGPLPPLLILLTVVTGLVDAFSYLQLGRVFVANMTGNVVFLAFALGGAAGFLWWASLLGIVMFLAGAFAGGRITSSLGAHRGRHLFVASSTQGALVLGAFVVSLVRPAPYGHGAIAVLIVLLGVGMGLQNATARALAVPDLTTTVLTLTLTGISADSRAAGGASSKIGRRLLSVVSMFLGALLGTVLIVHADAGPSVLLVAFALIAAVIIVAARSSRSTEAWTARK